MTTQMSVAGTPLDGNSELSFLLYNLQCSGGGREPGRREKVSQDRNIPV